MWMTPSPFTCSCFTFFNISINKALRLNNDGIDQFILFGFSNHLIKRFHLLNFFRGIITLCPFAIQNLQVKICKTNTVII